MQKILIFQNLFILNILILKELVESWQVILANHRIAQSILCARLKWKSTLISETVLLININRRIGMELISYRPFPFFGQFITGEIIKVFLCWTKLSTFNCITYLAGSSPLYDHTWKFCLYVIFLLLWSFSLNILFGVLTICKCLVHFVYLQRALNLKFREHLYFIGFHIPNLVVGLLNHFQVFILNELNFLHVYSCLWVHHLYLHLYLR